jgi:hypothetical protein
MNKPASHELGPCVRNALIADLAGRSSGRQHAQSLGSDDVAELLERV